MSLIDASEIRLAAFAADGELIEVAKRRTLDLSPKWLSYCAHLFESHGDTFATELEDALPGFRLRFTSANGAALLTVYVADSLAVTGILLAGFSPESERELCAQFVASVQAVPVVQQSGMSEPFSELATLPERPLTAIVFWGDNAVAETAAHAAAQLCEHLAAAYFQRIPGVVA